MLRNLFGDRCHNRAAVLVDIVTLSHLRIPNLLLRIPKSRNFGRNRLIAPWLHYCPVKLTEETGNHAASNRKSRFLGCQRLELPRARKSCSPADSPVWRLPAMRTCKPAFAQVTGFLPMHALRRCSERHDRHRRVRRFSCHDQFRSMAFARPTSMGSLRTEAGKLQRIGCRSPLSRQAVPRRTLRPELPTVDASTSGLRSDIFGRVPC